MNEPRAQPACGLQSGRHPVESPHQSGESEKAGSSSDLKVRLHRALGVSQSAASSASSLDSAWKTIIERDPWCPGGTLHPHEGAETQNIYQTGG